MSYRSEVQKRAAAARKKHGYRKPERSRRKVSAKRKSPAYPEDKRLERESNNFLRDALGLPPSKSGGKKKAAKRKKTALAPKNKRATKKGANKRYSKGINGREGQVNSLNRSIAAAIYGGFNASPSTTGERLGGGFGVGEMRPGPHDQTGVRRRRSTGRKSK